MITHAVQIKCDVCGKMRRVSAESKEAVLKELARNGEYWEALHYYHYPSDSPEIVYTNFYCPRHALD